MKEALRSALTQALRSRDGVAVAALRSALAAVDNAEAPDAGLAPEPGSNARVAGPMVGLGATEVARRRLSAAEVQRILMGEIADRDRAVETYRQAGRADRADRLSAEADVLRPYLKG